MVLVYCKSEVMSVTGTEQVDAFSFSRLDRHFKYDLRVRSNIETAFLVLVAEHVELLSDIGGSAILLPITRGCN